jgi:hypothetical protein
MNLCENSTYPVQIWPVRVSRCFTNCMRSHITDLSRFHNYSCILVVESWTTDVDQKQRYYRSDTNLCKRLFSRALGRLHVYGMNDLKMSYFYLYHERQANRGPSEMCSLLLDYIANHVCETVEELHTFIRQLSWPKQKPYGKSDFLDLSIVYISIKWWAIIRPGRGPGLRLAQPGDPTAT